jgi:hypothetical protein
MYIFENTNAQSVVIKHIKNIANTKLTLLISKNPQILFSSIKKSYKIS